jgi:putative membrane protein insertion efficiency factor
MRPLDSNEGERLSRVARALVSLPRRAGLLFIRGYQLIISPLLAVIGGPGSGCRFHPTCSHYAAGAVESHGMIAWSSLAARRQLKSHPCHPRGDDPEPEHTPFSLTRTRHARAPFRGVAHHNG